MKNKKKNFAKIPQQFRKPASFFLFFFLVIFLNSQTHTMQHRNVHVKWKKNIFAWNFFLFYIFYNFSTRLHLSLRLFLLGCCCSLYIWMLQVKLGARVECFSKAIDLDFEVCICMYMWLCVYICAKFNKCIGVCGMTGYLEKTKPNSKYTAQHSIAPLNTRLSITTNVVCTFAFAYGGGTSKQKSIYAVYLFNFC